jgi:hypothetical protein
MALASEDVFVVQKQTGLKPVAKVSVQQLADYFATTDAIVYKGTANCTVSGDEPSNPNTGDLYINDAAQTGTFAWTTGTGYSGTVEPNARALWNGTGWDVTNPTSGDVGVESIQASSPITVDATVNAASPIVGVLSATVDGLQNGVVTIATDADVVAGTSTVVVTAAQLKTTNEAISDAGGGTVTTVTGVAPIQVTDGTASSTPQISIDAATLTVKGAVTLADSSTSEPSTTTDPVATTPGYVDNFYLVKDFNSLPDA